MRALVIIPKVFGGGAEHVAKTWVHGLSRLGVQVTLVTYLSHPDNLATSAAHHIQLQGSNLLSRAIALSKVMRTGKFDVALSLLTYVNILLIVAGALSRTKTPTVISERNVPTLLLRDQGRAQLVQYRLARALYRHASLAIAISHPVAADLISSYRISSARCVVVPNPTALSTSLTGRRGTTGRDISIVLPHRLVDQKQPHVAIRAAAELSSRGYVITIHMFGTGPLEGELRALSAELGVATEFHGWVDNWTDACPLDSVVVLGSKYEGFGNVLLEAACAGIPSVATSQALGVADALVPGITGELSMTDAPADIADAIELARAIEVDATPWTRRFSPENSSKLLLAAITMAITVRK